MIQLRWLNTRWEESHESGYKQKNDRALQYRYKMIGTSVDICEANWSEWEDVEEEYINLTM